MALPASGVLALDDIQTEFGGTNPIGMSEYYRGGSFVTDNNTSVPTSGEISVSDFYSTVKAYDVVYHVVGAGGGGGGAGDGGAGSSGGSTSISGSGFTTVTSTGGGGGAGGGGIVTSTQGDSIPGPGGAGTTIGGVERGAGGDGEEGRSSPSSSGDFDLGGGGGGGSGGAGGTGNGGPGGSAGQYKTGTLSTIPSGTVITVTIGSGGAKGRESSYTAVVRAQDGDAGFVRLTINGTNYDFTSSGTHTV